MSRWGRLAGAFIQRELRTTPLWRYVVEWCDAGLSVVGWYFITQLAGPRSGAAWRDYFTFSLIGLAMTQYVWRGFGAFATRVRSAQSDGSFPLWWVTASPLPVLVVCSSTWDFLMATVNAATILLLGTLLFGAHLSWLHLLGVLGVGLLAAVGMAALGLVTSSWGIASGRGDVVRPIINKALPLLSGAFFPLTLLPGWLQTLAWFSPITHALYLARGSWWMAPAGDAWRAWGVFGLLIAGLALAGWGMLTLAIRQARCNGRLAAG